MTKVTVYINNNECHFEIDIPKPQVVDLVAWLEVTIMEAAGWLDTCGPVDIELATTDEPVCFSGMSGELYEYAIKVE